MGKQRPWLVVCSGYSDKDISICRFITEREAQQEMKKQLRMYSKRKITVETCNHPEYTGDTFGYGRDYAYTEIPDEDTGDYEICNWKIFDLREN